MAKMLDQARFNIWRAKAYPDSLIPEHREKHYAEWESLGKPKDYAAPAAKPVVKSKKASIPAASTQDALKMYDRQKQTEALSKE